MDGAGGRGDGDDTHSSRHARHSGCAPKALGGDRFDVVVWVVAPDDERRAAYEQAGATWLIDGTSKFDCSALFRVPDLGINANLAEGPNTVQLPALETGTVHFTCVMGMYSGNLFVVDPPA